MISKLVVHDEFLRWIGACGGMRSDNIGGTPLPDQLLFEVGVYAGSE